MSFIISNRSAMPKPSMDERSSRCLHGRKVIDGLVVMVVPGGNSMMMGDGIEEITGKPDWRLTAGLITAFGVRGGDTGAGRGDGVGVLRMLVAEN
jgi:hypothetical protein